MSDMTPWSNGFALPERLRTDRFRLEELSPRWAEPDYEAFWSCRSRLRTELNWGSWPPEDFTLADNRADLQRHHDELRRNKAYAYTVLTPDTKTCVGCIYINPIPPQVALSEGTPKPIATLTFWVTDEVLEEGYERHLLEHLFEWFEDEWPYEAVVLDIPDVNSRGIALCEELGLASSDSSRSRGRQSYVWLRD